MSPCAILMKESLISGVMDGYCGDKMSKLLKPTHL